MKHYRERVSQIEPLLDWAIEEAHNLLPESCRGKHWQAQKAGSPNPYDSVRHWYRGQADEDAAVSRLLDDLTALSEARGKLKLVLEREIPQEEPILTLPRKRRTP